MKLGHNVHYKGINRILPFFVNINQVSLKNLFSKKGKVCVILRKKIKIEMVLKMHYD